MLRCGILLLGFAMLGNMSIGLFYLPSALALRSLKLSPVGRLRPLGRHPHRVPKRTAHLDEMIRQHRV